MDRPRADLPGNRLAEPGGGVGWHVADGHHGRPGPVGRLDQARPPARVAEQRGVRVTHDGQDRHADRDGISAATSVEGSEGADGADDVRERQRRHAEQVEQGRGPLTGPDVHQLGARGVADLDPVLARQAVQDPRVHGAQAQVAAGGTGPVRVEAIEQPPGLRRGEHRIKRQAAELPDRIRGVGVLAAHRGGALVLPADQRREGFAGFAVPEQQGFPLGAQPDTGQPARIRAP